MKAEIFNFSTWIDIVDPIELKSFYDDVLVNCGFTIIKFIDHEFSPFGYTGLWLLEESHFALHTFPEEKKTYIEISSCNEEMYKAFLIKTQKDEYRTTNSKF